jgi:hypothetical protein
MKEVCGREGLIEELELILRDAFDAFNNKVCKSALWQCFHSPHTASVPYLHLQTFVDKGFFHAMPTTNHRLASCVKQERRDESWDLAVKLARMMSFTSVSESFIFTGNASGFESKAVQIANIFYDRILEEAT